MVMMSCYVPEMKTINTIEQEVNQIRLEIFEKTKDMTPAQLTAYYQKRGEDSAKKYGFKIIASANDFVEKPEKHYS
jgi:hypothetical protein